MNDSFDHRTPDALTSVETLRRRLGRSIRVLHIGNIANNAYNNAVIQRQYGIEADVACYDYYHVAGCPEWEDGAAGIGLDPFLPNWWATHLGGFKRPLWFAQAPQIHCVAYLDAYRSGDPARIVEAALLLETVYARLIATTAAERGGRDVDPRPWRQRVPGLRRWQLVRSILPDASHVAVMRTFAVSLLHTARRQFSKDLWRTRTYESVHSILAMLIWPLVVRAASRDEGRRSWPLALYGALRRVFGRQTIGDAALLAIARTGTAEQRKGARIAPLTIGIRTLNLAMQAIVYWIVAGATGLFGRPHKGETDPVRLSQFVADLDAEAPHSPNAADFLAEARLVVAERTRRFARVLEHYDIVQGYALDAVIPLAAGFPAIAAYEHGTIRDIPFEDSVNRILCRAAYRHAHAVFVTNTDVFPSIGRMGLDPARVHDLPHAFDDRKLRDWRIGHPMVPPKGPTTFFAPTRQHWMNSDRSLAKGNDIYLRGLGELHRRGVDFRLIVVEWGRDVAASKELIAEFGYASRVEWIAPLDKRSLWAAYCTSHAVIDQFTLPALGGVGFEVLALGCRLITAIDAPRLAEFFGAAPPVLNAATVEEFVAAAERVVADPDDRAGIGEASARWIEEYHSARRIVDIQARVYARLLDEAKNRA